MQDILNDYFRIAGRLPLDTEVTDATGEASALGDGFRRTIEAVTAAHEAGNTLRLIGNGGSAGIASHMAVDFSKRGGIRAAALNDPAMLTCLANDLGYDEVFAHQLALHIRAGDGLVTNCDEVALGAEEQCAFGDGRCGHTDVVHAVLGKSLELAADLENMYITLFAREVDLSVTGDR